MTLNCRTIMNIRAIPNVTTRVPNEWPYRWRDAMQPFFDVINVSGQPVEFPSAYRSQLTGSARLP